MNSSNYALTNDQIFADQQELVKLLAKPGRDLLLEMTPHKMHLIHMHTGLSGECGELIDALKKYTMYNKQLDMVNVKEEIGDIMFYLIGLTNELNIDLYECMLLNQTKLNTRYPNGYSNKSAIERVDKE